MALAAVHERKPEAVRAAARAPEGRTVIQRKSAGVPAYLRHDPLQRAIAISQAHDPAEREAETTARAVVTMAAPATVAIRGHGVQRLGEDGPTARTPAPGGSTSGEPLPTKVRSFMEPRFRASFAHVRIHTGERAAQMNRALNARAFTTGNQIFFGKGQFQPETPDGLELIAHELTHTIQQGAAVQRAEAAMAVRQSAPAPTQRLGFDDVLDWLAEKAYNVPGYRMFTIVLGVNPINGARVERSAANILRAVIEFIPGGHLITQALDKYGVFEKVGGWVEQQIETLGMVGAAFKDAFWEFIDSLGWRDLFHPGDVWDRAKRIFMRPIDRLIDFGKGLVAGIIKFIKEAILKPLASLAEGTRGWDLLCAVLGRNPITGEAVPRTAERLVGGFMKFIGQEEVWKRIQQTGALSKVWAWFQNAIVTIVSFVARLPGLALEAVRSLTISDILLLPRAILKILAVFGNFALEFVSWAGRAVWNLLEIVFSVVSPGAWKYIQKTGAALKTILRNPLPFVGNLVRAAKGGFDKFASRFLTHLKAGLIDWLTGSLPGIYIPKAFELAEIAKFVMSVLGLSWANIRAKLVRAIGEPAMKVLETTFDIVVTLVRDGPAAAWDKIKEQLANLKDMVIGGITDFVVDTVVKKAIPKLIAMFIPGAGFISAIVSIYDMIMVFVEKISKIIQVVTGFIDSIVAIAGGVIGVAVNRVEGILANLLSLAISFLAGFAGLGKVADKIKDVLERVRQPIDRALDWLVNWIVTAARRLGRLAAQAGVPQDPNERLRLAVAAATGASRRLGGRVTRPLLEPIMTGLKVRYGLTALDVFERGGIWWARAAINPTLEGSLDLPALVDPANTGQQVGVLDLYRGIYLRDKVSDYDSLDPQQLKDQLVREEDFADAVYNVLGISRADAPTTTAAQRRSAANIVVIEVQQAQNVSQVRPWWSSTRRATLFFQIIQRFINKRTAFQRELRELRVTQLAHLAFSDVPFISTTKNPQRAAQYAKGVVVATNLPPSSLPSTTNKVVGKVFVYLFSGDNLSELRAADIQFLSQSGAIAANYRYSRADAEVTFTGSIPAANRVGELVVRENDSVGSVAAQARQTAQTSAAGRGRLLPWT